MEYLGKRLFIPAHFLYTCGFPIHRWSRPPGSSGECRQQSSVRGEKVDGGLTLPVDPTASPEVMPRGWSLHPTHGYLCPDCTAAVAQGLSSRQLASQ